MKSRCMEGQDMVVITEKELKVRKKEEEEGKKDKAVDADKEWNLVE